MSNFIGTGKNPNYDEPDLPLGLGMELAQSPTAMDAFGRLTGVEKTQIIRHIQASSTGDEAKERIAQAVRSLAGDF